MKILLGSKNPSKKNAVEIALKKLGIENVEIIVLDVPSNTNSRPIGYEIIRGAENRNAGLKEYAIEQGIDYDYLCSIEGGFLVDESGTPFLVNYCIIEDKAGEKSAGRSSGIRLTKTMFEYVMTGKSLNKIIEKILNNQDNKKKLGILGYLTNGLYSREDIDSEAVISSMIPLIYRKQFDELDRQVILSFKSNRK